MYCAFNPKIDQSFISQSVSNNYIAINMTVNFS